MLVVFVVLLDAAFLLLRVDLALVAVVALLDVAGAGLLGGQAWFSRRRGGNLTGFVRAGRDRRRRGREAAAFAGVVEIDQARVLWDEARGGGEEDITSAGGGVDEL